MAGHEKVYGICENKSFVETGAHSKGFTYEVNSDDSLAFWLSNKQSGKSSGGEDFTSVLIRKGEWSFIGNSVALNRVGTIHVEGEAGNKLVFTDTSQALWYNSLNPETSMTNINVECTDNDYGACFESCSNLTNCTGNGTSTTYFGYAFKSCSNLINCTGTGTGRDYGTGFHRCSNLINCTGTGTGSYDGTGFYECHVVHGCKAGGHCTTVVFNRSYASYSSTETYACADTTDGGFNNTTNPSAE